MFSPTDPAVRRTALDLLAAAARDASVPLGQWVAIRRSLESLIGTGVAAPPALDEVAHDVREWQLATFGEATQHLGARSLHLLDEAAELRGLVKGFGSDHPEIAAELADTFILTIGLAEAAGVDLAAATRAKLEVLRQRTYDGPDAAGIWQHNPGSCGER